MGNAIWLIYFAGVAESLQIVLGACAFVGAMAFTVWFFINKVEDGETPPPNWLWKWPVALGAIAIFIPNPNVLYAAAAVDSGDAALKTQTGDKAVRALNAWLDRQIKDDGK